MCRLLPDLSRCWNKRISKIQFLSRTWTKDGPIADCYYGFDKKNAYSCGCTFTQASDVTSSPFGRTLSIYSLGHRSTRLSMPYGDYNINCLLYTSFTDQASRTRPGDCSGEYRAVGRGRSAIIGLRCKRNFVGKAGIWEYSGS